MSNSETLVLIFTFVFHCSVIGSSSESSSSEVRWMLPAGVTPPPGAGARAPHHVTVVNGRHFCSGALVSSRSALTAASCVQSVRRAARAHVRVKAGATSIAAHGDERNVEFIKIHEYFGFRNGVDNDIAILFLQSDVDFGKKNIEKVILIKYKVVIPAGIEIYVSTWGTQDRVSGDRTLRSVRLRTLAPAHCRRLFNAYFTLTVFCAEQLDNDTFVEMGGPAVYDEQLIGLMVLKNVPLTADSDEVQKYILFTNIAYYYRWIKTHTKSVYSYWSNCQDSVPTQKRRNEFVKAPLAVDAAQLI